MPQDITILNTRGLNLDVLFYRVIASPAVDAAGNNYVPTPTDLLLTATEKAYIQSIDATMITAIDAGTAEATIERGAVKSAIPPADILAALRSKRTTWVQKRQAEYVNETVYFQYRGAQYAG